MDSLFGEAVRLLQDVSPFKAGEKLVLIDKSADGSRLIYQQEDRINIGAMSVVVVEADTADQWVRPYIKTHSERLRSLIGYDDIADLLDAIHAELSGTAWGSETSANIAALMDNAGYIIDELED